MGIERICVFCTALALGVAAAPASAFEIYRWVDEDGVVHYSDSRPVAAGEPVETLDIPKRNPPGYDPADDYWSVLNQAERINDWWTALEERREKEQALERARAAEARLAALEARVAAAEAAFDRQPVYAPFAFARGHLFDSVVRPFPHRRPPPRDRPSGPPPGWPGPAAAPPSATPGFAPPADR